MSSGAILVDLPGIADANAARNNVAAGYMKEAHRIWIVAPITRAVDDGTAQSELDPPIARRGFDTEPLFKELLGDMFKAQLLSASPCLCFSNGKGT